MTAVEVANEKAFTVLARMVEVEEEAYTVFMPARRKVELDTPDVPAMDRSAPGDVVPIPNRLFVLSQKNVLSPPRSVPLVKKPTCPAAPTLAAPPTHVPLTATHPPVRLMPYAMVEVAEVDVMLSEAALMVPLVVVISPCETTMLPPETSMPPDFTVTPSVILGAPSVLIR